MSLFSWFENLFGGKWTNETVVQYEGDSMDHGTYSYEDHIKQLRERRPTLHQTQRLLVDSKIRELEYAITSQRAREKEAERKRAEENHWRAMEQQNLSQRRADEAHKVKSREPSKPVTGNVIAKPPKFDYESDNSGWTTPAPVSHSYTPSHSHTPSHSCSGSSHSHDSGGGGGGCD